MYTCSYVHLEAAQNSFYPIVAGYTQASNNGERRETIKGGKNIINGVQSISYDSLILQIKI